MECVQCQGLLVEHHFFDLEGTQGFMWMRGWRCLHRGHAADPISRGHPPVAQSDRARVPTGCRMTVG